MYGFISFFVQKLATEEYVGPVLWEQELRMSKISFFILDNEYLLLWYVLENRRDSNGHGLLFSLICRFTKLWLLDYLLNHSDKGDSPVQTTTSLSSMSLTQIKFARIFFFFSCWNSPVMLQCFTGLTFEMKVRDYILRQYSSELSAFVTLTRCLRPWLCWYDKISVLVTCASKVL